jgi:hypothetical protein
MGREKLLISLNLGTDKPEKTEFDVDEPASWITAIGDQIRWQPSQKPQEQQPLTRQAAQYCMNCGVSLPVGSKFCSHCGTAQA